MSGRTLRSLLKDTGFTIPAVIILGFGVGATVSVGTIAHGILLSPLPFPDGDRLVAPCERHASLEGLCIGSVPTIDDLASRSRTVVAAGTARGWSFTLTDADGASAVSAGIATPGYFEALGVEPSLGRLFAPDEVGADRDGVVVLTHGFWMERYGGDAGAIGSTFSLDDEPVEVVGVLPPEASIPFLDGARLWRPVHVHPAEDARREWRGFRTLARLAPGVTTAQAAEEWARLYRASGGEHEAIGADWSLDVVGLRELVVGQVRPALLAFLVGVVLLLVVACANVANLVLTRSARRRRNFAIRAALGAGRGDLAREVLSESTVVAVLATALGTALAWTGTRAFLAVAPASIPRLDAVRPDPWLLAGALGVAVISVGLAALLPTLRGRRTDLLTDLRIADPQTGPTPSRGLGLLATGEIALAVVLTFGSVLFARSLAEYLAWDPGFDPERVMTTWVLGSSERFESRDDITAYWRALEAELSAIPGVVSAATVSNVPLGGGLETSEYRTGATVDLPDDALPSAHWFDAGPGYFRTMGIAVRQGRELEESDVLGAEGVAVINESLARIAWPDRDPIGEWIEPVFAEAQGRLRIVGVVADVPPLTPGAATPPAMYWSNRRFGRVASSVAVRFDGDAAAVSEAVRATIEAFDPGAGVASLRTIAARTDLPLAQPRFAAFVASAFAGIALLLAALGLYGVLAYRVTRRSRAIGIRLALGSTAAAVVRGVVGDGFKVTLPGLGLGLAAGAAAGVAVREIVPGASASDPGLLLGTATLVLLLSALAAAVPALRAGRIDPARLLREE